MTPTVPTVHRYGPAALLVEVADLDAVLAVDRALRSAADRGALPTPVDQVPAARTVLLVPPPATDLAGYRAAVQTLCRTTDLTDPAGVPGDDGRDEPLCIPVVYDGADLDEVGEVTGLGRDGVVAAHVGTDWRVAFGGFVPGFGYLSGGDDRLAVPRRREPRPAIPAGAVGLAGTFSGIYPRSSPGGWQLIGRTELTMWDPDRTPPALLRPGVRVRFVDAGTST